MPTKKNKKNKLKLQTSNNVQIFRRTALATAITVAVAPMQMAAAGTWRDQPWGRNIELSLVPTTQDRGLMAAQLLQPLFGNNKTLNLRRHAFRLWCVFGKYRRTESRFRSSAVLC